MANPQPTVKSPTRHSWLLGPILTVAVALTLELLSGTSLWIPNAGTVMLPIVVLSGFLWGLRSSMLSAVLGWVYFAYYFSIPGELFHYTDEDFRRVMVWAVANPATAAMVGLLKRRGEQIHTVQSSNDALTARLRERDRAEQALRDGEVRLVQALQYARTERDRAEMYLDIAGVIIVALDFDGRITLVNRRGCEALGLAESELLAKNWFTTFVPPARRDDLVRQFREVMNGARPLESVSESSILTPGGERTILWHHALLHGDAGRIIGTLSSGEDITEYREQQVQLRTRARQQAAVSQLGLRALSGLDLDALFDQAVALLAEVLHVEYANVLQLLPDGERLLLRAGVGWNPGLVGSATVDAGESQAGHTLRSAEPVLVEDMGSEKRFRGPALLADHHVAGGMSVAIQGRERPFGVLGAHTTRRRCFLEEDVDFLQAIANVLADAIERKRAEQEIHESSEQLRRALRAARMGTWDWDVLANRTRRSEEVARLLGRAADQPIGNFDDFLAAVHSEDRAPLRRKVEECLADVECVYYIAEYRVVWPDESIHWLADQGQVYRDRNGRAQRLAGVTMDITARKHAEEQTRVHQAELAHVMRISDVDEMASGLAHELNQPLTAVVNFAQGALRRLKTEGAPSASILEAIEGAAAQAHRAGEIVRRLARFVQKRQPQQTVFPINDAVTDVVALSAGEARDYEAVIHTEVALENPSVSADNIQVEQVILNLVRNGLEAMNDIPKGERVMTIRTQVTDGEVQVSVADRGPGLSEEALKSVFRPFFTTKQHGMGLGLSISRSIIDAHGGRLWAVNDPGGGAVFQFTLPLAVGVPDYEHRADCLRC